MTATYLTRILAISAMLALPAMGANMFVDPGFESSGAGWTSSGDWASNSFNFNSGARSFVSGCQGINCILTPTSFLYQDLTTVVGLTYDLRFSYMFATGSPNGLRVLAGGLQVSDLANQVQDGVWRQISTTFTATSTTTRVQFSGRNDNTGVFLDDVFADVSSTVPEPSSLLFAGVGLAAVLGIRRQQRS